MSDHSFFEGVKPGGLTTSTEIRILLCYILENVTLPVSRAQLDEVLLGEELVNYFVLAQSLAELKEQGLIKGDDSGYALTESGRTIGKTLAMDLPKTVRQTAIRGLIAAQQYAAKKAEYNAEIMPSENGFTVQCKIKDFTGELFSLSIYMPDSLSANLVKEKFIKNGNEIYALLLGSLTNNRNIVLSSIDLLCK